MKLIDLDIVDNNLVIVKTTDENAYSLNGQTKLKTFSVESVTISKEFINKLKGISNE